MLEYLCVFVQCKSNMFQSTVRNLFKLKSRITLKELLVIFVILFICLLVCQSSNNSKCFENHDFESVVLCPIQPRSLVGEFNPDISEETLEAVETRFMTVLQNGGYFKPKECRARDRVAVLVTCRGREKQLPIFLKNIHSLMMRQQLEYQIFVIFQTRGFWFNKGALYNVGYVEAMKRQKWDCFIFHDIDTIPMDDRNMYDCPRINPRHMAVDVDKFNFK